MTNELIFYFVASLLLFCLLQTLFAKESMCMCSGAQCTECILNRQQQQERVRSCNYPKEFMGVV